MAEQELSQEDIALIEKIKNKYLSLFFDCKLVDINKEVCKAGIEWLYELSGFKKPIVDFVVSPFAAQELANEIYNKDSKEKKYFPFSIYGNVYNFGLCAFYEFFEEKGIIKNELFTKFKELILSGIYDCIQLEDRCIVCQMPYIIKRNDRNQLHNPDGPAIAWSDDYKIYCWNGINVAEKIIERPHEITKDDIVNERNIEVRRCMQEKLGPLDFIKRWGLKVVHRGKARYKVQEFEKAVFENGEEFVDVAGEREVDREVILYRTEEKDNIANEYLYVVEVSDPSTDRKYHINVPPRLEIDGKTIDTSDATVYDALGWTFKKKADDYKPEIET